MNYKKMYMILCATTSDSLDILSKGSDEDSINHVRFLLQQAMLKAENIYTDTATEEYGEDSTYE